MYFIYDVMYSSINKLLKKYITSFYTFFFEKNTINKKIHLLI